MFVRRDMPRGQFLPFTESRIDTPRSHASAPPCTAIESRLTAETLERREFLRRLSMLDFSGMTLQKETSALTLFRQWWPPAISFTVSPTPAGHGTAV